MATNYDPNYDPNEQQMAPVQNKTFMDYVKENKLMVILAILVLAGLIWWFCMRKGDALASLTGSTPKVASGTSSVNVTRTLNRSNGLY